MKTSRITNFKYTSYCKGCRQNPLYDPVKELLCCITCIRAPDFIYFDLLEKALNHNDSLCRDCAYRYLKPPHFAKKIGLSTLDKRHIRDICIAIYFQLINDFEVSLII